MPRSKPARCRRSDRTGVRCRSNQPDRGVENADFLSMSAGTPSGSCLRASWQATRCRQADSQLERFAALQKIECGGFGADNVERETWSLRRCIAREHTAGRGGLFEVSKVMDLSPLWCGRAGSLPRAARFCQPFPCGCSVFRATADHPTGMGVQVGYRCAFATALTSFHESFWPSTAPRSGRNDRRYIWSASTRKGPRRVRSAAETPSESVLSHATIGVCP